MKISDNILKEILNSNIDIYYRFECSSISIDTRTIKENQLFIAINGKNFNGNKFAKEALAKGASSAIIDDKKYEVPRKTILVDNSLEALKKIGKYIQNKAKLKKSIAITGSVGKTTTKHWINQILINHKYNSFCSIKNYNTIYGLPISLSLLENNTDFGIFELGTNSIGEISELSNYLSPDIAIITNIYEAHLGKYNDLFELQKEKMSIVDGLNYGGTLIFNGDLNLKKFIKNTKNLNLISVGFSDNCNFQIKNFDSNNNMVTLKTIDNSILNYKIGTNGLHFAYTSALVIASLYALNLNINDFLKYFEELKPISGRGEIINCTLFKDNKKIFQDDTNFKVIDDSYNCSPSSLFASLQILDSRKEKQKVAIIGQMKELGDKEYYYHRLISEKLEEYDFDNVFFIGDKNLWQIFEKNKKNQCFEKIDDFVIEKILEIIQNDSIVLLKGSRSIGLEKFLYYIYSHVLQHNL